MELLKIGLIGVDTSHATAFAKILHDTGSPYHIPGARISAAFPQGSPDFKLSIGRVETYVGELREKYQVAIVDEIGQLREMCDAVFLESIDGRVHPEQLLQVLDFGVPVFVDKPFAISSEDAQRMFDTATSKGVRVLSSSALRYAEEFKIALAEAEGEQIVGGDFLGQCNFRMYALGITGTAFIPLRCSTPHWVLGAIRYEPCGQEIMM